MQSSLDVGDEVMLTSGVYARVQELADDHVLVEIADGVVIKVARGAVGSKVHKDEPVEETGQDEESGSVADGSEEN